MSNRIPDRYFIRAIVVLSALFFLISCGGGGTYPAQNPTLQSIALSPQNGAVAVGLTQQYTATGTYSDGSSRMLSASTLTWSTSDAAVAAVNSAGLVTTLKQGTVTISAATGAVSNTAPLQIGPPIPTALNIVPANSSVVIGATIPTRLSAILTYSDNTSKDISGAATWSVSNPFTASVDSSGGVTALRTGYATISAASGTFKATSAFVVTAEPRYLYFMSDAGRLASKAVIDSVSGQLRMTSYIPTGANNYASFPCPKTGPSRTIL